MGLTAPGLKAALVVLLSVAAARVSTAGSSGQTPRTTRDKVYSKTQAARGERQYAQLCASCHDPSKVPAGKKPGPPLVGDKFLEKWQDRTLGDLLTTIQTTMPNDGSAVLSDDETAEIVAYVLQANGFADGAAALKSGAESKDIVIVKRVPVSPPTAAEAGQAAPSPRPARLRRGRRP